MAILVSAVNRFKPVFAMSLGIDPKADVAINDRFGFGIDLGLVVPVVVETACVVVY
jgi:hypothetical protein